METVIILEKLFFILMWVFLIIGIVIAWKTSKTPDWINYAILGCGVVFVILYIVNW